RALRAFVDEVLSYVPTDLPSHVGHPQWTYHLAGFTAARYQFLSSHLGPLTETTEPPSHLSRLDQIWWKLDGRHKRLSRRRAEGVETINHQRDLIQRWRDRTQKAILEEQTRERQELDQQFLDEFTGPASRSPSNKSFAQISFDQNVGSEAAQESSNPPAPASQWFEILGRYEDKYSSQRQQEKARQPPLQAAPETINPYYPQPIVNNRNALVFPTGNSKSQRSNIVFRSARSPPQRLFHSCECGEELRSRPRTFEEARPDGSLGDCITHCSASGPG